MKNYIELMNKRDETAKKIAQLLAESGATCWELDDIFGRVKGFLVVQVKD